MDRSARTFLPIFLAGTLALASSTYARAARQQDDQSGKQDQQSQPNQSKKSSKAKQKSDNALKKELESPYKKWLDEDVVYIISPEERHSFLHLSTNEEREQFIE